MSVRAQWFTPGAAEVPAATYAQLSEELADLMHREGALFNCGVTCPIRDAPGACCSACPLSHHADRDDRLQPLCIVGRRSDRVLTRMAMLQSA